MWCNEKIIIKSTISPLQFKSFFSQDKCIQKIKLINKTKKEERGGSVVVILGHKNICKKLH